MSSGADLILPPPDRWSIADVAKETLEKEIVVTREDLERVARKWAERVREKLDRPPRLQRKGGTGAEFASFDSEGKLHLIQVWIPFAYVTQISAKWVSATGAPHIEWWHPDPVTGPGISMLFMGTGGDSLDNYFDSPITPLIRVEVEGNPTPTISQLRRYSLDLTKIAIGLRRDAGDVGGPIDQLHLSRTGAEWLAAKPNCKDH
jgi:hypothetical protein